LVWHENENDKVKTPEQLFDLYLKSVGRGANLLLNIPPDRRGRIHANDSTAVVGLKKLIDKNLGKSFNEGKRRKSFF
jgi:alpha-L-fucosidase